MLDNENVIKLPDALERRAQRIEAAMARRAMGEAEWIEGTIELAVELAGARAEFPADQAFGEWFAGRFSTNAKPLTHDERAILIRWGKNPTETHAMLEKTDSRSIRYIDRSLRETGSVPEKKPLFEAPKSTVSREEAKEVIRAYRARHGSYPNVAEAVKASGKSRIVIEPALAAVVAEDRISPPVTRRIIKADAKHLEALAKLQRREIEKEFEARVTAETKARIDLLFPRLEQVRNDAMRNEKLYRERLAKTAIFTKAEYIDILFCTRNLNVPQDRRDRATIALEAKKLQLIGE